MLVVAGTRPELIKQAPLIRALRDRDADVRFCWVAQHRELVAGMFDELGVWPDIYVPLPPALRSREQRSLIRAAVENVIREVGPDVTVVQGDTTTAYAAAMAGAEAPTAVAHVEAGLRSDTVRLPWPEEPYRRAISRVASLHFAPTPLAQQNLRREGVSADRIWVTGNTGIDSLLVATRMDSANLTTREDCAGITELITTPRPFILATMHRRESFGSALPAVLSALQGIVATTGVSAVFVRHANPLQAPALETLEHAPGKLFVAPPLSYGAFVSLLSRASVVLTDSGGVTEEATALGIPVLVVRNGFERQESLAVDTVKRVSPDRLDCLTELTRRLPTKVERRVELVNRTFGDGRAAARIAEILLTVLPMRVPVRGRHSASTA